MRNPVHVSDVVAARLLAMPVGLVVRYCRQGRFVGAYLDRVTWHWRIPCPVRLSAPDRSIVR
jgi:hypothetical protein